MESEAQCPGPACLANWIAFARALPESGGSNCQLAAPETPARQAGLFTGTPYEDTAPSIRDASEFRSAVETLAYALFRLETNRLTRAERPRLENLVENALFKMDRYRARSGEVLDEAELAEYDTLSHKFHESRRVAEERRNLAAGIRQRMERIDSLDGDAFEDFVAEVFEALGYEVHRNGGAGDEGADLKLARGPLRAVVQCKYHHKGIVGSPDLQKFLGTIHQSGSRKGYFVTTTGFTLSAEKFAANQPMELIDGPRLAEIVREILKPAKPDDSHRETGLFFRPDDDSGQRLASH
ncbi:restriction endonuclease [bacterium]|nr:restriction endonuclease [bacterium]